MSLVQRIGRGGRKSNTLRTVLGIILARNIPSESLTIHDPNITERLAPSFRSSTVQSLPIATDNPQVIRRGILVSSISTLAKSGRKTYASREPIKTMHELREFMLEIIETMKAMGDKNESGRK